MPEEALHDPVRRGRTSRARATTSRSSRSAAWCGIAQEAAEQLANEGIDCEVVDPRTTSPLDDGHDPRVASRDRAAGRRRRGRPALRHGRRHRRRSWRRRLRRPQGARRRWSRRRTRRCRSRRSLEDLYVPGAATDRGRGARGHRRQVRRRRDGRHRQARHAEVGPVDDRGPARSTGWSRRAPRSRSADEIAEVETEKINGAVESPAAGVLRRHVGRGGRRCPGRRAAGRDRRRVEVPDARHRRVRGRSSRPAFVPARPRSEARARSPRP